MAKAFIKIKDEYLVKDLLKRGFKHKFVEGDGVFVYEKSDKLIAELEELQDYHSGISANAYAKKPSFCVDKRLRF